MTLAQRSKNITFWQVDIFMDLRKIYNQNLSQGKLKLLMYTTHVTTVLTYASDKGMVRSDMSKRALIFCFTARVHTTKSTVKILGNTHCKYFLKIAQHCQCCNLPDPWRNVHT
jgi:hypothetical protein